MADPPFKENLRICWSTMQVKLQNCPRQKYKHAQAQAGIAGAFAQSRWYSTLILHEPLHHDEPTMLPILVLLCVVKPLGVQVGLVILESPQVLPQAPITESTPSREKEAKTKHLCMPESRGAPCSRLPPQDSSTARSTPRDLVLCLVLAASVCTSPQSRRKDKRTHLRNSHTASSLKMLKLPPRTVR